MKIIKQIALILGVLIASIYLLSFFGIFIAIYLQDAYPFISKAIVAFDIILLILFAIMACKDVNDNNKIF